MKQIESYEDELYQEAHEGNKKLRHKLRKNRKLEIKQKRELKYIRSTY